MVTLSMSKTEIFACAEGLFYASMLERTKTEVNIYWSLLTKFGKTLGKQRKRTAKKFVDDIMVEFAKRHPEVLAGTYVKSKKSGKKQ